MIITFGLLKYLITVNGAKLPCIYFNIVQLKKNKPLF